MTSSRQLQSSLSLTDACVLEVVLVPTPPRPHSCIIQWGVEFWLHVMLWSCSGKTYSLRSESWWQREPQPVSLPLFVVSLFPISRSWRNVFVSILDSFLLSLASLMPLHVGWLLCVSLPNLRGHLVIRPEPRVRLQPLRSLNPCDKIISVNLRQIWAAHFDWDYREMTQC